MKKKFLVCDRHGETLFRCKRRYWSRGTKKDKGFADDYTEKCFKCILEGRYKKGGGRVVRRKVHQKI